MDLHRLDDTVTVAPQLLAEELAAVARLGFRTVINNRPDGESFDQPPSAVMAEAAQAAGLAYHHQPVVSGGLSVQDVLAFRELLASAEGPVLAFCRSGTRCANLWALAQAGSCDPDAVIASAASAGYDLRGLRQILQAGI
ncbi:MAG: TIGR01244 family sulfur transferase [Gammaproteobacteria bacterium]